MPGVNLERGRRRIPRGRAVAVLGCKDSSWVPDLPGKLSRTVWGDGRPLRAPHHPNATGAARLMDASAGGEKLGHRATCRACRSILSKG